jgi:hypothetical protein
MGLLHLSGNKKHKTEDDTSASKNVGVLTICKILVKYVYIWAG